MNSGGITGRIIRFANAMVGWIRGGLGLTNIAASIGGVMIPGTKKAGYPAEFAAAVTATSSTVGPMIPPSVPLLALAEAVGIEPLHFATFAVLNLMIGQTTPPVGVCLFVCANIARLPLSPVVRAILPFLATNITVLLLVPYIPALATWLPSILFP